MFDYADLISDAGTVVAVRCTCTYCYLRKCPDGMRTGDMFPKTV